MLHKRDGVCPRRGRRPRLAALSPPFVLSIRASSWTNPGCVQLGQRVRKLVRCRRSVWCRCQHSVILGCLGITLVPGRLLVPLVRHGRICMLAHVAIQGSVDLLVALFHLGAPSWLEIRVRPSCIRRDLPFPLQARRLEEQIGETMGDECSCEVDQSLRFDVTEALDAQAFRRTALCGDADGLKVMVRGPSFFVFSLSYWIVIIIQRKNK